MHVRCPYPCCMTKSVLRVHFHTACPCPYCMSVSMLNVHVNAACLFTYIKKCRTVRHLVSPVLNWKQLFDTDVHLYGNEQKFRQWNISPLTTRKCSLQCWSSVTPFVAHDIEIVDFRRGGGAHRLLQPFYEDPYVVVSAGPKFFFAIAADTNRRPPIASGGIPRARPSSLRFSGRGPVGTRPVCYKVYRCSGGDHCGGQAHQ
jgi:hypothetical protein